MYGLVPRGGSTTLYRPSTPGKSSLLAAAYLGQIVYKAYFELETQPASHEHVREVPWMVAPLAGIAVGGPLGTYLLLHAVRFADVSALAPFQYIRLVVNTLAGLVVFREIPGIGTSLGLTLILAGCLLPMIEMRRNA